MIRLFPRIDTPYGRRAWAFLALCGAAITFTLMIVWALYVLKDSPGFIFWLAMAAHAQVFVVLGALGWVLGRRMSSEVTKDGVSFDDRELNGK